MSSNALILLFGVLLLTALVFAPSEKTEKTGAAASIQVLNNCIRNSITETAYVNLGNEQVSFILMCHSYAKQQFQTNAGVQCELETGMCTQFYPYHMILVRCADGLVTGHAVACPSEGPKSE